MIAVTDLGVRHLDEIAVALRHAGASDVRVTSDPAEIGSARAVVIAGAGDPNEVARELHARKLDTPLRAARARRVPILGIGVGMQLFFEEIADHPEPGLGFYCGSVSVDEPPAERWLKVRFARPHPWLREASELAELYFVQPGAVDVEDDVVLGVAEAARPIAAAVGGEALLGIQFDPVRSGVVGAGIVAAFVSDLAR